MHATPSITKRKVIVMDHILHRTTRHHIPSVLARFWHWRELARERAALARLDPHLLRDIGLTDEEARREAGRSAWDVPDHWHV